MGERPAWPALRHDGWLDEPSFVRFLDDRDLDGTLDATAVRQLERLTERYQRAAEAVGQARRGDPQALDQARAALTSR